MGLLVNSDTTDASVSASPSFYSNLEMITNTQQFDTATASTVPTDFTPTSLVISNSFISVNSSNATNYIHTESSSTTTTTATSTLASTYAKNGAQEHRINWKWSIVVVAASLVNLL